MLNVRIVSKITPVQSVKLPNGELVEPFLIINVDPSSIQKTVNVIINKNRLFATLANKDVVVGAINKRLCTLIQQYLERQAEAERRVEL